MRRRRFSAARPLVELPRELPLNEIDTRLEAAAALSAADCLALSLTESLPRGGVAAWACGREIEGWSTASVIIAKFSSDSGRSMMSAGTSSCSVWSIGPVSGWFGESCDSRKSAEMCWPLIASSDRRKQPSSALERAKEVAESSFTSTR